MEQKHLTLIFLFYNTLLQALTPGSIIFDAKERSLNKVLAMRSSHNTSLNRIFASGSYSENAYELRQITMWTLKRKILDSIISLTNLENHTTLDAQVLHQLSGLLIEASSAQEALMRWTEMKEKYTNHPLIQIDKATILLLYKKTQAYLEKSNSDLIHECSQFYQSKYGPLFHDMRQIDQESIHPLQDIVTNGLTIHVEQQFIPLLKQTFQSNPLLPLSDQLKNIRLLTTNGLKESKVSFLCHDSFDHLWLFNYLKTSGMIKQYKHFFDTIGNPHMWDIFSREGELIASIGFEYRLYLASHNYKPLFDIAFIKAILEKSSSSTNQKKALTLLSNKILSKRFYDGLPIIYSGIIIELMEQRRKHGFIKCLDQNNNVIDYLHAFDPEYTALIVDVCALLFGQEEKIHEVLSSIAILTEKYLSGVAQDKEDQPLIITLKDIEIYRKKLRWFKDNPGFAATRKIIS